MSLWLVRAGRHGEQEQGALDNQVATIGWNELPDLSGSKSREELRKIYLQFYPKSKKSEVGNKVGQLWRFVRQIQPGDLVALPLKTQSAIAIGKVEGAYEYKQLTPNIKHIRRLKWLETIPRSKFDQDILYSLGSLSTVCKIERNNAESRVRQLLQSKTVTGPGPKNGEGEDKIDIECHAKDQIVKYIEVNFKGHDLASLVEAILQAQGYVTKPSPPGPDGGVDILAAAGPLGFDRPKVCVQVKSTSSPVDARVLRELRGVMSKHMADQGLLVSWGGFTNETNREAKDAFFSIRLWDQGALIEQMMKYYDRFNDELKAELPLKRIWALVIEEKAET